MSYRRIIIAAALATTSLVGAFGGTASAGAATTTCTWGGTPAAPTGTVTMSPGVTNLPAPGPLKLRATGALAGGGRCTGTMTFVGQVDAGSTCSLASFEGIVKGLPGVTRFWGKGTLIVPELLYDAAGNVVGADQPEIMTPDNEAKITDCGAPGGFPGGTFAATVELF